MHSNRAPSFLQRLASEVRRARVHIRVSSARSLISELDDHVLRDLGLVQAAVRGQRP
jgi:hypothetical protein